MTTLTFVTGGARSGKSGQALSLARAYRSKLFIATAQAFDEEMAARIARHREEREDSFVTVEEPLALAGALSRVPEGVEVVVLDCLTVWLGNVMHHRGFESPRFPEVEAFLNTLDAPRPWALIVVSNELGLGIVPENALARRFRDVAGEINQQVAARADRVMLMVSGIPLVIKGECR